MNNKSTRTKRKSKSALLISKDLKELKEKVEVVKRRKAGLYRRTRKRVGK